MQRKTAYKMAIEALQKQQRKYAFDHNLALIFEATRNEGVEKNWQRYTEAISIIENEMEHKQLDLFSGDDTEGR
jgi:hypothetical protein